MQVGGGYPRKQLTRRAKKQLNRKKQLTRRATKQLARKKQLTRRAKEQRKKQLRNQQVRKLRRCQCPMKRLGRMPLQVEAAYCMASIGSLLEHGEHRHVHPVGKSGQTSSG